MLSGAGKLFGFARTSLRLAGPQPMRGTDPVRQEAIQLKCPDDVRYARTNLSVSHLAGFMATVHWTTSFLA